MNAVATDTRTLWFIDALFTIKVSNRDGDGTLSLLEAQVPADSMPPLHVHDEDEAFYVLDGDVTFYVGDRELRMTAGDCALAPRDVPHTYRVGNRGARWLVTTPGKFEDFVRAASRPADRQEVPPRIAPTPAQSDALAAAARESGLTILGPPGMLPTEL